MRDALASYSHFNQVWLQASRLLQHTAGSSRSPATHRLSARCGHLCCLRWQRRVCLPYPAALCFPRASSAPSPPLTTVSCLPPAELRSVPVQLLRLTGSGTACTGLPACRQHPSSSSESLCLPHQQKASGTCQTVCSISGAGQGRGIPRLPRARQQRLLGTRWDIGVFAAEDAIQDILSISVGKINFVPGASIKASIRAPCSALG